MIPNLWTDVDALARLARSEDSAQRITRQERGGLPAPPAVSLPPFHDRTDFRVETLESPATFVTGDCSDTFLLGDETLVLTMADVSGKGVPAALVMGVTRSVMRNVAALSASPAETLSRVNRILVEAELDSMFVTVFLGWYETRTGRLRFANAGHPLPYRIEASGAVSPLGRVTGPILGILEEARYEDAEAELALGDRLILYTDGVTEARSPYGEFFGTRRLAQLLEREAHQPLDRLCRRVARTVDEFQARRRHDDATLLALVRTA